MIQWILVALTALNFSYGEAKKKAEPKMIPNVEIKAQFVKDNKNYIYLESETERIKLIKKELTKEGIKQILKNKDTELILFVPETSIKYRKEKKKKKAEEL